MKLFGATIITRKIILEGGLIVVDDGSGSGSGAAVGANDASLTVFETTSHYDYDHTRYTDVTLPVNVLHANVKTDCGLFVAAYAEYLSDGLQVPNDGLDAGLLRKRYAALL
ncbi:hypothetical protein CQW23_07502 [Capsicum baccatum]|uniref:Ubiquitin-like protease family profile domain-containing protein n=1 Tax=Capsicum baccatum TaxID=33114 RepID=A0A2G2X6F5_CAPBA|nr:hypothetical protein CQW23_07502 [Capsicum baccatum]